MLRLIIRMVARLVHVVGRVSPGVRLLARLRRRDGLKWGVPAMLIAVPYLLVAGLCVDAIQSGGPVWLNGFVLWCVAIAVAYIANGPISLVLLTAACVREGAQRRRDQVHEWVR